MALTEKLELDISAGLSSIDTLESHLTAAAKTFGSALGDALSVLAEPMTAEVNVEADTDETQSELDGLDGGEVDVEVTDDVDETQDGLDGLDGGEVDVEVTDNTDETQANLDGLTGGEVVVEVATAEGGGLDDVSGGLDDLTGSLTGAAAGSGALSGALAKVGPAGGAAAVGIGVAGAGLVVYGKILSSGLTSTLEVQAAQARLAGVFEATGNAANTTVDDVWELAEAQEALSGVSADVITEGAALLGTFVSIRNEVGEGNAVYDRAVGLLDDFEVLFGSASSGALQLGKALEDPAKGISAMARSGISFTQAQQDMIRSMQESGDLMGAQKEILNTVEGQLLGVADAYGKSLPGQIDIAKRNWEALTREAVEPFLPLIGEILEFGQETFLPSLQEGLERIQPEIESMTERWIELLESETYQEAFTEGVIAMTEALGLFASAGEFVADSFEGFALLGGPLEDLNTALTWTRDNFGWLHDASAGQKEVTVELTSANMDYIAALTQGIVLQEEQRIRLEGATAAAGEVTAALLTLSAQAGEAMANFVAAIQANVPTAGDIFNDTFGPEGTANPAAFKDALIEAQTEIIAFRVSMMALTEAGASGEFLAFLSEQGPAAVNEFVESNKNVPGGLHQAVTDTEVEMGILSDLYDATFGPKGGIAEKLSAFTPEMQGIVQEWNSVYGETLDFEGKTATELKALSDAFLESPEAAQALLDANALGVGIGDEIAVGLATQLTTMGPVIRDSLSSAFDSADVPSFAPGSPLGQLLLIEANGG